MKRFNLFFILLLTLCTATSQLFADVKTSVSTVGAVLYSLENRYVDTINTEELTEIAIKAMLKELDPHTNYMSPKEVKQFREGLDGEFEGIGVTFRMVHDTILVIHPVSGGPSEQVGIEAGDLIVSCNDSVLAGQKHSTDDIKKQLRGPRGSVAHLGIKRDGHRGLLYFDVKRGSIAVPSVNTYYMVNETIGYIHVERFAMNTAHEVAAAMKHLTDAGMKHLIIDLQGNGGGYLNAAVEMASLFLPPLQLVVYTEGRSDDRRQYKTSLFDSQFKGNLAVILDEQSASASEIFAGCIQDYDRGVIIGRRSFGKGLVQRPVDLPNGGMMRLTVSHYYTPSGRCIQKPYTKGNQKDYQEDLVNRLHNGEMVSADSIHLADSLRFYTRGGRVVYGGGGIMPDEFVPLDTTRMQPAHRALVAKSTMLDYTVKHFRIHHHRILAQYPTLDAFADEKTGYKIQDAEILDIIDQARHDSIQVEGLDSLLYNDLFRTQVLAYIANNLYDNGAYKRIINRTSSVFAKAIEILGDKNRYKAFLEKKEE